MDAETLNKAMDGRLGLARYQQLLDDVNRMLVEANCTTVNRVAMLLAQVGEESGSLQWKEELSDGSQYNGRTDLGNTQPGDGPRFKGRSWIQITGRHNYTVLSQWAHSKGYVPSADYFVQHPTDLADDKYAGLGPVWYWTQARNMNSYADQGDIEGATRAVNGGLNGYDDRVRRWNNCRHLGEAILPTKPQPKPTDQDWSDSVNKEDLTHLIRDEIKAALQAIEFGGDGGVVTEKISPNLATKPKNGDRDRLTRLENKVFGK